MYKFSYEPISFHQKITYNFKMVCVNNILELKLNENASQIAIIIYEITMKYNRCRYINVFSNALNTKHDLMKITNWKLVKETLAKGKSVLSFSWLVNCWSSNEYKMKKEMVVKENSLATLTGLLLVQLFNQLKL